MQCPGCQEQLDDIMITNNSVGFSTVVINDKFTASFYVCTNRDCKNCGIVLCIPWNTAEEDS